MCSHSLNNSHCEHLLLLPLCLKEVLFGTALFFSFFAQFYYSCNGLLLPFAIPLAQSGQTYALKLLLASGLIGCQEVSTILQPFSHLHFVDVILVEEGLSILSMKNSYGRFAATVVIKFPLASRCFLRQYTS